MILTQPLFGDQVTIASYQVNPDILEPVVLLDIYQEGLRLQRIFNFYDPTSELSQLNKAKRMEVSPELREVISMAIQIAERTGGAYDIALGKSILNRKQGIHAQPSCSYKDIVINNNNIAFTNPEVQIDLGSIAKGYIVDRMVEYAQANGITECLIDARGDIRVAGSFNHQLGIQDPRADTDLGKIQLCNQAVATSGDYSQYVGNFSHSHILHQTDLTSISVVAPTLIEADVWATALFVVHPDDRSAIIDSLTHLQVFTVDTKGSVESYNNFDQLFVEN